MAERARRSPDDRLSLHHHLVEELLFPKQTVELDDLDPGVSQFPHRRSPLDNGDAASRLVVLEYLVQKRRVPRVVRDSQQNMLAVVIAQIPSGGLCVAFVEKLARYIRHGISTPEQNPQEEQRRGWCSLTLNFRVGSFFSVSNVDEVKRGPSLCEAQRKVFKFRFPLEETVSFHRPGKPGQIGAHFGNDFHIVGQFSAVPCYLGTKRIRRFLSPFYPLSDQFLQELEPMSVKPTKPRGDTGPVAGEKRTIRPSPSIRIKT